MYPTLPGPLGWRLFAPLVNMTALPGLAKAPPHTAETGNGVLQALDGLALPLSADLQALLQPAAGEWAIFGDEQLQDFRARPKRSARSRRAAAAAAGIHPWPPGLPPLTDKAQVLKMTPRELLTHYAEMACAGDVRSRAGGAKELRDWVAALLSQLSAWMIATNMLEYLRRVLPLLQDGLDMLHSRLEQAYAALARKAAHHQLAGGQDGYRAAIDKLNGLARMAVGWIRDSAARREVARPAVPALAFLVDAAEEAARAVAAAPGNAPQPAATTASTTTLAARDATTATAATAAVGNSTASASPATTLRPPTTSQEVVASVRGFGRRADSALDDFHGGYTGLRLLAEGHVTFKTLDDLLATAPAAQSLQAVPLMALNLHSPAGRSAVGYVAHYPKWERPGTLRRLYVGQHEVTVARRQDKPDLLRYCFVGQPWVDTSIPCDDTTELAKKNLWQKLLREALKKAAAAEFPKPIP